MYPEFLCIGAPKAGTTWLFDNLSRHPDIWLPPSKAIQYFTKRANARRWKKLKKNWRRILSPQNRKDWGWRLKYHFWPMPNLAWYESLFPDNSGKLTGEIAPSYTTLSKDQVAKVKDRMPDAKIIFLMRNPIERVWSHAMLNLVTNGKRTIESLRDEELLSEMLQDDAEKRTNYTRTLEAWQAHYPKEQMFVGFYDDVGLRPFELLQEICAFLGVKFQQDDFTKTAQRNIFKGPRHPIPLHILETLRAQYGPQINELAQRFGGHAQTWLETHSVDA